MSACPTCPNCWDLCPVDARWCPRCGWWLLERGPTATEVRIRARLAEVRGVPGERYLVDGGRPHRQDADVREET